MALVSPLHSYTHSRCRSRLAAARHRQVHCPHASLFVAGPAARWRAPFDRFSTAPRATAEAAVAIQSAAAGARADDSFSSTSSASPGTAAGPAASAEPTFVWTNHWWPLFPVACLRPDRPNAVTLLGMPLVAWRDGGGTWRVFRDACPHRLAPLSEGRLESDGSLSCAYHGWRFSGSGACSRIPQALDAAAEAAACGSRRACATAYPAREEAGMLWVWPDGSPGAVEAAAASCPQLTYGLRARAAASAKPVSWFARELPYSYEVLVENLLDPAHLPFSHHGVEPALQRSLGGPMPMKAPQVSAPAADAAAPAGVASATAAAATAPAATSTAAAALPPHWTRPEGPDVEYEFVGNISQDATISFTAPHLVTYTYRLAGGGELNISLFATPVAPGRSRFFSPDPAPPPPGAPRRPMPPLHKMGLKRAVRLLRFMADPVASMHRNLNTILDGDGVFLHVQDEVIRAVEAEADAAAERAAGEGAGSGAAEAASGSASGPRGDGSGAATVSGSSASGGGGLAWSRAYFLPTPADNAMLAARRWLEERAGGGPFRARARGLLGRPRLAARGSGSGSGEEAAHAGTVPGEAPSPSARSRLLDRYEQHTRHCPVCSTRLAQLRRVAEAVAALRGAAMLGICVAAGAAGAAAALQGGAAAAAAVAGWPAALAAACAAVAAAATAVERIAREWAQEFLFVDYVHAEKD